MNILVKRVYEKPDSGDGLRILVDRLWPRGLSKEDAKLDAWMKGIAPSDELRRWYQHELKKWPEFKQRYFCELDDNTGAVRELVKYAARDKVVLLFAAKDSAHNNAVALQEYMHSVLSR